MVNRVPSREEWAPMLMAGGFIRFPMLRFMINYPPSREGRAQVGLGSVFMTNQYELWWPDS